MEHLRDISIFVLVAKAGNFKSAAIQLGVPGSTISRRIAALERALNVRLFDRNTRNVVLTEAGEKLLARTDRLLNELHQLSVEVDSEFATPSATIRISVPPEFAESCLGKALADFMRAYPEIKLELDSTSRPIDLIAERFDVALRQGEITPQSLVARAWLPCTQALYASPDYIDNHGEPIVPPDLAEHQIIVTEHSRTEHGITLSRSDQQVNVAQQSRLHVRGAHMAKIMCLQGAGLALLPDYAVTAHVEAGRLLHVLEEWTASTDPVCLVTPSRIVSPATRLFLDFLFDRVKGANVCRGGEARVPLDQTS